MSGVDVLAALRQIADGDGDGELLALQARAAVAELIEAARELDEELDGPPIAHRLRAALANVTGGGK